LDLCEWNNLLAGASETKGGQSVGGMIAARGCVFNTVATMPRQFTVAVVWQGRSPTIAPSATTCGSGTYADDKTRRAVVAPITIGCLQNDPKHRLFGTPRTRRPICCVTPAPS